MTRNFLLVGLGGALGSIFRYGTGLLIGARAFPLAILLVNVTGSLIIGMVMAFSMKQQVFADDWKLFLATGLCGGFTTFSAFSLDNLTLFEEGKYGMLALNVASSILLGIAAVWLGYRLVNFFSN